MSKSNETTTTTVKEEYSSTDNLYEKYEITEELKEEIKEEILEYSEIKEEKLYKQDTEEIKTEIKDEEFEDVKIKKEVTKTLEENIDVAIATGTLDLAGNITVFINY